MKIFIDFAPSDEIHSICRTFYDAYLSGDKRSRLFVTLLFPTMLQAYLLHLHDATIESSGVKQQSPLPYRSRRNSHPVFTLGEASNPTNPLESLALLLSEFCQLAPAFIRFPEHISSSGLNLPNYQTASVYHSPPLSILTKSPKNSTDRFNTQKLEPVAGSAASTFHSSAFPDLDPSCLVRIYADTMSRQFVEGTEEQQGIVLLSIRTFCDLIERLTALNARRILSCNSYYHQALLIDLTITIDKLLFILSFEISQPVDLSANSTLPSDQIEMLLDRLFEQLLPKLERYATYHCFASELLTVSAVRNAWRLRLHPSTASVSATAPLYRRIRLTSDELTDLSESTASDERVGDVGGPATTHRASVFTNANFRAEPVAEDIPIDNGQEVAGMSTEQRKLHHFHHSHNLVISSHNHIHSHIRSNQSTKYLNDELRRSSDKLHSTLSLSSLSLDRSGHTQQQHYKRFWSKQRQE